MDLQQGQLTLIASGVVSFPPVGNPRASTVGCLVTREAGSPTTFLVTCDGQPFANFPFDSIIEVDAFQANGFPIQMFWVYVNASSFRLIARQTTNGVDTVISSFNFKVFRNSSFEQVDLGPIPAGPSPFPPFVPASSGGTQYVFVFRPGGVAAGNVYTNWALLMADCNLVSGARIIEFDGSAIPGFPVVIPAGAWNMTDVTWTAIDDPPPASGTTIVEISDGVVLTGLRKIIGNYLFITCLNTTPTVADFGGPHIPIVVISGTGSGISSAASPFFSVPAGASAEFQLYNAVLSTGPSIFVDAGAIAIVSVYAGGTVLVDSIAGDLAGLLTLDLAASGGIISDDQPNFSGVITSTITAIPRYLVDPAVNPVGGPQLNSLTLIDTSGGPQAVALPPITRTNTGQRIVIKKITSDSDNITITPNGADTIDMVASFVFGAPMGSVMLISDFPNSTWWII